MSRGFVLSIILMSAIQFIAAQDFNTNDQYKQAMINAKVAFDANQYSEAVMFYREAIKLKPDALLPRYKIEDIRTIYIAKELENIDPANLAAAKKAGHKRKNKKRIQAQQEQKAREAGDEATRKMNRDADMAQAELKNKPVGVVIIVDDVPEKLDTGINVEAIHPNKQVGLHAIESKAEGKVATKKKHGGATSLTVQKRHVPEKNREVAKNHTALNEAPKDSQRKKTLPKPVYEPTATNKMDAAQKQVWIKNEQERLANTYPNKKTVEEVDKPGKHITRVIMNIDNKVTIYLKVKHSWGATYFFIDEVGYELKSINEQYYNLKTNLETYGG